MQKPLRLLRSRMGLQSTSPGVPSPGQAALCGSEGGRRAGVHVAAEQPWAPRASGSRGSARGSVYCGRPPWGVPRLAVGSRPGNCSERPSWISLVTVGLLGCVSANVTRRDAEPLRPSTGSVSPRHPRGALPSQGCRSGKAGSRRGQSPPRAPPAPLVLLPHELLSQRPPQPHPGLCLPRGDREFAVWGTQV